MPIYAATFGPIQTAYVSYKDYDLDTPNLQLVWATSYQDSPNVVAAYMRCTNLNDTPSPIITLPNATQVSVGENFIISNMDDEPIFLHDFEGNQIDQIDDGVSRYYLLRDNSEPAGTWVNLTFGAGVSQATASELAGFGLNATIIDGTPSDGTRLNTQTQPKLVPTDNPSFYQILPEDYGDLIVWTGGGGDVYLPSTSIPHPIGQVPAAYYVSLNNAGSGTITLHPSPAEPSTNGIQGQLVINISPGQTLTLISNGEVQSISGIPCKWFTLGFGQQSLLGYNALTLPVGGNTNITLSPSQASNDFFEFTGTLTGPIFIYFPQLVALWTVYNNTTGDTLTIQLINSGGTPIGTSYEIPTGYRLIFYSTGASLFSIPDPAASGGVNEVNTGTGLTGGPITSTGTISLGDTLVTPGSYTSANIHVDAQGRITFAENGGGAEATLAIIDTIITSDGTHEFNAGLVAAFIQCWGGGASGASPEVGVFSAFSGLSGGYSQGWFTPATLPDLEIAVTVGNGGSAVLESGCQAGGDTYLGDIGDPLILAPGGPAAIPSIAGTGGNMNLGPQGNGRMYSVGGGAYWVPGISAPPYGAGGDIPFEILDADRVGISATSFGQGGGAALSVTTPQLGGQAGNGLVIITENATVPF